jgi:hypothetical protein
LTNALLSATTEPAEGPALERLLTRLFTADDSTAYMRDALLTAPQRRPSDAEPDEAALRRVEIKPLTLKGRTHFQFAYHTRSKVTHRNLASTAAKAHVHELLESTTFHQVLVHATDANYHLSRTADGHWSVRRQPSAATPNGPTVANVAAAGVPGVAVAEHNRRKSYILPEGEPVPFLNRLGVMTADGRVIAARYDKFRQINRFLEMVADVESALPTDRSPLRIVDFGSGKSTLTFALYHYLRVQKGWDVRIVGLDVKRDVIAGCNAIARDLGWDDRLTFEVGEIQGYTGGDAAGVDMVVSLHACDTATDDALAKAVGWGATVILSVPCCQHELFRQIAAPEMRPLLKHGVLKERLSALVTDAARAALLEASGYHVQVMEFIDMEHTPKNLLLRAVRRKHDDPPARRRAEAEYRAFRDFWHVSPHLERVLGVGPHRSESSAFGDPTPSPDAAGRGE